ncbi:hypothetical protein J3B02_001006 [Coemansia erecta]|nr:hypothetical protein J3B02_001006 [Coemansia erecta]
MRTDTGPSGNGGSVNASNGSANNVNGIGGIAPELTVYSEQRLGGSDSSRSQRSVPSQQSQQMF